MYKEGVDIPSLDGCIQAGGGKSEIATYQNIGRGLRRTKTKHVVLIFDFMDKQHDYVKKHYLARYALCKENGWLADESKKLFSFYDDKS